jgi:hypothetical protein
VGCEADQYDQSWTSVLLRYANHIDRCHADGHARVVPYVLRDLILQRVRIRMRMSWLSLFAQMESRHMYHNCVFGPGQHAVIL